MARFKRLRFFRFFFSPPFYRKEERKIRGRARAVTLIARRRFSALDAVNDRNFFSVFFFRFVSKLCQQRQPRQKKKNVYKYLSRKPFKKIDYIIDIILLTNDKTIRRQGVAVTSLRVEKIRIRRLKIAKFIIGSRYQALGTIDFRDTFAR